MRFGPSLWALPLALAAREARLASDARKPSDASGSRVLLQAHAELQRTNETQKETPFSALVEAAAVGHPVASSWSEHACAALGLLLTACLTVYLKFVVEDYEERATPKSPPWFCDEVIIFKVGSGVVLAWMLIGIVAFTRVLNFSVIGTVRKLDLLEAIYLCSDS
ncbi:unnamed protein product [Effrenium voratum]|nr:unnamed protein product [Effrenium voratum]